MDEQQKPLRPLRLYLERVAPRAMRWVYDTIDYVLADELREVDEAREKKR